MGSRGYVPQLGRFLQPDPEPGGSSTPYGYTNADPINAADPSGRSGGTVTYNYESYAEGEGTRLATGIEPGAILPPPPDAQLEEEFRAHPPWSAAPVGGVAAEGATPVMYGGFGVGPFDCEKIRGHTICPRVRRELHEVDSGGEFLGIVREVGEWTVAFIIPEDLEFKVWSEFEARYPRVATKLYKWVNTPAASSPAWTVVTDVIKKVAHLFH
jgi:hypothetical protein